MIYCVKCEKCDYILDVNVSGWSEFEKYKEENSCPKCKSKLITDIAKHWSGGGFSMESIKTSSKKDARMHRANKRRMAPVEHQKKMKKDPYYGMRDKSDPNYKGI